MKLTSVDALNILNEARKKCDNQNWIEHSICVGNSAGRIAQALKEKGDDIDVDKTITLGYIHDIGKIFDDYECHVMNGYRYLKEQGYDDDYCNICLTHSYLNNDVMCVAGRVSNLEENQFKVEFIRNHQYTLSEKIINLCDLMCTRKILTIDKRLINLIIRYGAYENTQYHVKETIKLKQYFDELLGYNLYDLFPEVKDNL